MRKLLKRSASFILIPLTKWYLRKERNYSRKGISISVLPGVFHPGLFSSTELMIDLLEGQSLYNTTLLELGCGSSLISIVSAKAGAHVTACDLSTTALKNAEINIARNNVAAKLIHSNLFDSIPKEAFDWIIINPPYYARSIQSEEQLAWHCGENFEYFVKLFSTLNNYMNESTKVIMVLAQNPELEKIFEIAQSHNFHFEVLREKYSLFDGKDFIYRIKSQSKTHN